MKPSQKRIRDIMGSGRASSSKTECAKEIQRIIKNCEPEMTSKIAGILWVVTGNHWDWLVSQARMLIKEANPQKPER